MSIILTESKYRNVKVDEDGYTFDSKAEHQRYRDLKLMQAAGEIDDLTPHPSWDLIVNGQKIGRYTADFLYTDQDRGMVVEDVKSSATKTRFYQRTKKHMRAQYGIVITEIEV